MRYVPPLTPKFDDLYRKLDSFFRNLEDIDESIEFGIVSVGEAAKYALVWEWGNVRQTKAGPKTTLGVNPDGNKVWLTIQAPYGYIRVNTPRYWKIIYEEIDRVNFNQADGGKLDQQIKRASERISKKILDVLRNTVPVDEGDLRDSLRVFTELAMLE